MKTLYRKSTEEPNNEGIYNTSKGLLSYSKTFGWVTIENYTISEPDYWLEEIPCPSTQSLEEIRDTVAKNRGYENWETLNGSDLYDSDIDEVAKMYAESENAQLQADKAELLSMLEGIKRLEPIICMGGAVAEQWQNEAQALNEMMSEIDSLIQKHKQCGTA